MQNALRTDLEKGSSDFDIRQRFTFSSNYALPFGNGVAGPGGYLIRDWEIAAILTLQSGSFAWSFRQHSQRRRNVAPADRREWFLDNPTLLRFMMFRPSGFRSHSITTTARETSIRSAAEQPDFDARNFHSSTCRGAKTNFQFRQGSSISPIRRTSRTVNNIQRQARTNRVAPARCSLG